LFARSNRTSMQPEVRVMLHNMEDPVAPVQQPPPVTQADIKDRFYRHFQQECTEIQEQIVLLEDYSLIGGEKQDAINHVLSGISRLSTEVSDSSGLIPAYDQRIYAQALKHLKRNLKRLDPRLHQGQDSDSRPRRKIHRPFLSTMQQSWRPSNALNLPVG